MKTSVVLAALVAAAFISGSAFADTIAVSSIPIAGTAGQGGMHVVTVDGLSCKVKNSATTGAQQGCNYNISLSGINAWGQGGTWTVVPQQNNGCSTKCE